MNIYVGNLSLGITEEELRSEFTIFGQVTSVRVLNKKSIGSGQPSGYAYIDMPSTSEGWIAANTLNGKNLRGRAIEVVVALPLSDKKKK